MNTTWNRSSDWTWGALSVGSIRLVTNRHRSPSWRHAVLELIEQTATLLPALPQHCELWVSLNGQAWLTPAGRVSLRSYRQLAMQQRVSLSRA